MNIVVCVKHVPDPEAPVTQFTVDSAGQKMVPAPAVVSVVSPFDENAIEAGLQLKEAHGGKVTVLSLGPLSSLEALKRGTRMGADDAVLVEGNDLPEPAPQTTAHILAKAIAKIGGYDLILCGRQAADWDQGQVGCGIAENLDLPYVSIVSKIETLEKALRIQCLTEDGYEVMEVSLPVVLTLTNEINQPRLTTVAGILRTTTMKIPVWSLQDIGVDPAAAVECGRLAELKNLRIPEVKVECQIVGGETPEEAALSLVNLLRSDKII
ncbi:MAG TPA: electron transfer flavoprotein subunit beta [Syntrophus sp. (in: bacteria)]|nr:electron transfer flavoprotein subunit beta [Syntrophus sp. (in: bacteria)]